MADRNSPSTRTVGSTQGDTSFGANQPTQETLGNYGMAGVYANAHGLTASERERYANLMNYYTHQGDLEWQAAQTELEWSRNSPQAQLQQLMALGMTRQAALQAIQGGTAQAAQATSAAPGVGQASPLQDLYAGLKTTAEVAMTAFSVYTGAAMFGVNLLTAQHAQRAAKASADVAQRMNEGEQIAGSLFRQFNKSKSFMQIGGNYKGESDEDSITHMLELIQRAADNNDPTAKEWLGTFKPLYDSNPYAQTRSQEVFNGLMSTRTPKQYEEDRDLYIDSMVLQNRLSGLNGDNLVQQLRNLEAEEKLTYAEIAGVEADTKYTGVQTTGQIYQNESDRLDLSLKNATFKMVKATTIKQMTVELAKASMAATPQMLKQQLKAWCYDTQKATFLAASMRIWAGANEQALRDNPDVVAALALFDSDNFKRAMESLETESNSETFSKMLSPASRTLVSMWRSVSANDNSAVNFRLGGYYQR